MSGDRVTDGVTEATVKVLTSTERPALYTGKSLATKVFIQVPMAELSANPVQQNNNQIFSLVGKIVTASIVYTTARSSFGIFYR